MSLDLSMGLRRGDLDVALDLRVGSEVVAVLGPNGAGKTTVLRAIAGLESVDRGRIALDGRPLDEPGAGIFVPPARRSVGMVFQDYLLFPFLSARDNVAFGVRRRRVSRARARAEADEWLARMGLTEQADLRPGALSGGQAQRVALARALAIRPRLLLLDEPLSALDATVRPGLRRDLRAALAGAPGPTLLVTHDLLDVVALASRVVVLEHGSVAQVGPVAEVAARPRSRYVAELVGLNVLPGRAHDHEVRLDTGGVVTVADVLDGEVYVAIHPHAVALHRRRPEGSMRNVWRGVAREVHPLGGRVRVSVDGPVPLVAEITSAALAALELSDGTELWASVKATEVVTYPA